jgi:hypothetical protein
MALSKEKAKVSQMPTSKQNGLERLKLKKRANIGSLLLQMMDLDFGLTIKGLLITGDFMEQEKETAKFC